MSEITMNCLHASSKAQNYEKGLAVSVVPFYSSYKVGEAVDNFEYVQDKLDSASGTEQKEENNKEPGKIKTMFKGIGKKIQYAIPIYGTYKLGKDINELKQARESVDELKNGGEITEKEKAGVLKNIGTGLAASLKMLIPFYGSYYKGKQINEVNNLANDIKALDNAGNSESKTEAPEEV